MPRRKAWFVPSSQSIRHFYHLPWLYSAGCPLQDPLGTIPGMLRRQQNKFQFDPKGMEHLNETRDKALSRSRASYRIA